jgi:hypothetical protein
MEVMETFKQFMCMAFCMKIQGFNMKLAEQFTLSFDDFCMMISGVIFQVAKETMSTTIDIPLHG